MTERIAYILMDEKGNYVGDNSIQYDKETKQHYYVYSRFLSNSFFTYTTGPQAQVELYKLKALALQLGFKRDFYIKRIELIKELTIEYNRDKDKCPVYPFVHELICVGRATGVA